VTRGAPEPGQRARDKVLAHNVTTADRDATFAKLEAWTGVKPKLMQRSRRTHVDVLRDNRPVPEAVDHDLTRTACKDATIFSVDTDENCNAR
jgi:hypothetical protein